jgi:CubicO group peptidase (beta-lactamase class C family)
MRILASAFVVTATLAAAAPARAASDLTTQLDAIVAPHFPADAPGAAVLVRKGDEVLLRKSYGMANLELAVPMRAENIFRLGSVTKQFTAAAIMMLVEAGKLSLDDDVRKYVPDFPAKSAPVTLAALLTHTSGVPNYTDQPAFHKRSREDLSHEELLATFKDLPLEFAPGERWRYSNSGYYLLGLVIEKVSGKRYAQFLDEHIFKPLKMTQTSYGDDERIIPGRVAGYDHDGEGFVNAEFISMKLPFSAGSLVSSVDDLARWDRAISDGKLLKKASWARIFTAAKLKDGSATHYGFGWSIGALEGHRVVLHGGGIPGFTTAIVRLPEDRVVAVVLCNSFPAPTDPGELAMMLAAAAIGKPIVDPKIVAVAPEVLERYVGVYKIDDKMRLQVRRAGAQLTMQRTGGPLLRLEAAADDKFFLKDSVVRVKFTRDKSGHVTGADITQTGGVVEHRARTNESLPAERAIVAVDAKILESYTGRYELAPGFVLAITREGAQLFAQATGQPRFEIYASAPNEFFLKVVDAQLTFHADSVVMHQGGRDMPGKRLPPQ